MLQLFSSLMDRTLALTWSWLGILNKKRYDALIQRYKNLGTALQYIDEQFLKALGCREDTIFRTLTRLEEFNPDTYEKELKKRGLELLSIEDEDFPSALRNIPDPPIFLTYRGDLSILDQPCIALVGTRDMSTYGKRVVETFVPALVQAGMVTVSGLAAGIDAQVARDTIAANGKTVAALGHGLAQMFPAANRRLADEIVENGGLLLSEFPLDQTPDKYTFPARNRIIAALSLGTIVLEAGEGSGALITADFALEYGKDVFAVPGQIFDANYAGCHSSIARSQSRLVTSPQDVLTEIGIVASSTKEVNTVYTPQNAAEEAVLRVLTTMPQPVSDLVEKSKLASAELSATLTMMELSGAARNIGNGQWVRQ